VLNILSNPLVKRLRVFHLVLSVISVMVVFTLIQGYVQLRYIDSVQQVNQKMSNTLLLFNKDTTMLKSNVMFIKENYLKRLSGLSDSSALDYTFSTIDKNLKDIEKIAQSTSANTRIAELVANPAQDLIKAVKELKKLAYAADTKEDYLACEAKLFQAIKDIDNIGLQVDENSYNTSTDSRQASQNQKSIAIILLITGTCIAVLIGLLINASISWPLREIIKSARAMAEGDFTRELNTFGCRESYEVVEELNASLDSLRLLIGEVIKELNGASKVIADISSEIREITDESSLLSLNAAIEASRAGEQGKGFSVVAHSIGRLAERCRDAAKKIDGLTDHMMERAEQAARLMDNGVARVEGGKNLAGKAAVTFEGIFTELKFVLAKINAMAGAAQEMSRDNEKVITAVSNIAAISEESMASSEEVSASAEEQNAAAQEVTLLAENLLHISNEMKNSARVFKV
jgi:methyl-accepting chemotaxis protein